jgi:hypothetical protein
MLLLFLTACAPVTGQEPSFHQEKLHGRRAYVLENGIIRLSALRGGGHFGEIRFLAGDSARTVNPMRVPHYPTVEPHEFDDNRDGPFYQRGVTGRVLGGYMGHFLCLPEFGGLPEAAIVEWKLTGTDLRKDAVTLHYEAELPKTQFRVGRLVMVPAGTSVIQVEEWAENLMEFGRPMHWVEHVTFGPPFAEPGKHYLDMAPARWAGRRRGAGLMESIVRWPQGLGIDATPTDLRLFPDTLKSGRYNAYLFDRASPQSYFTAYHAEMPVLIGYVFPAPENPWLVDWQENGSYQQTPWEGKSIARGIEIGTTPFDEGLKRSLERGNFLGVPGFRWIGGRQRLTMRYLVFLAEIPKGFAGVETLDLKDGKLTIRERGSGRAISLDTGGFEF